MGVVRKYVDQIVVMNTLAQGAQIRALAAKWGVSIAEISRVSQSYGLPAIDEHYTRLGLVPDLDAVPSRQVLVSVEAVKGRAASKAPKAQFVSP